MIVVPLTAAGQFEHAGTMYDFCNPRCQGRFGHDPEGYLTGKHQQSMETEPAKPVATYIFSFCGRE
ncbi:MAG: hypothetical protein WD425_15940 [Nitrospirales bacterium]